MNPIQLSPLIKKMMIVLVVAFVVTKTGTLYFRNIFFNPSRCIELGCEFTHARAHES
jgi:hypothetical protein